MRALMPFDLATLILNENDISRSILRYCDVAMYCCHEFCKIHLEYIYIYIYMPTRVGEVR